MSPIEQITILYEDENLVIINKPAGIMVHPDGKTKEKSVSDWVLSRYSQARGVGEPTVLSTGAVLERHGVVHRIDKETSGVLVLTKNQKTFSFIKKQFQDRSVEKVYHAIVWGEIKDDRGEIDLPIGRSKSDFRKWSVKNTRGEMRNSKTKFKVLGRKDGFSLVEVYPETGRTHQIRVHFKAIEHPLVGDSLYAPKKTKEFGFARLALHARTIKINTLDGKILEITAPYPPDFEKAVDRFYNLLS